MTNSDSWLVFHQLRDFFFISNSCDSRGALLWDKKIAETFNTSLFDQHYRYRAWIFPGHVKRVVMQNGEWVEESFEFTTTTPLGMEIR